jgi:hypothetical protein
MDEPQAQPDKSEDPGRRSNQRLGAVGLRKSKEMAMRIGSAAALTALLLATAAPFLPACSDPVTHRYVVGVSGMH